MPPSQYGYETNTQMSNQAVDVVPVTRSVNSITEPFFNNDILIIVQRRVYTPSKYTKNTEEMSFCGFEVRLSKFLYKKDNQFFPSLAAYRRKA